MNFGNKGKKIEEKIKAFDKKIGSLMESAKGFSLGKVIDRAREVVDTLGVSGGNTQKEYTGSKMKDFLHRFQEKSKATIRENKEAIISAANDIAEKCKLEGKKVDVEKLVQAVAASAVLALGVAGAVGLNEKAPQREENRPTISVDNNPENTNPVNVGTTMFVPQTSTTTTTESQETVAMPAQEQENTVQKYVVDLNDVYESYEVNNAYGFINFRDNATTNVVESNIITKIQQGETIYLKPAESQYFVDNMHDWRRAVYYPNDGTSCIEGFVDARLLQKQNGIEASIVVKDEDVQVVDGAVNSENEIEIAMREVSGADFLRVRETPSTADNENVATRLPHGSNVYTYGEGSFISTDEGHDWKKALYSEGKFYKSGYIDASYLSEEIPPVIDVEVSEEASATTAAQTTTTTAAQTTTTTAAQTTTTTAAQTTMTTAAQTALSSTEAQTLTTAEQTTTVAVTQATRSENNERITTSQVVSNSNVHIVADQNSEDDWEIFAKYPGYVEYLEKLKVQHPNWVFKASVVGFDFDDCVDAQVNGAAVALQIDRWDGAWMNPNKVHVDGDYWYVASKEGTACMMDPRNFLNEKQIMQFEKNCFNEERTVEDVENALANVPWAQGSEKYKYTNTAGEEVTADKSFAEMVFNAAKKYDLNPIAFANRIIGEQGSKELPAYGARGNVTIDGVNWYGYYNFGNINSYGSGQEAWASGVRYAKERGWTSPEISIDAMAQFIKARYVDGRGQDNIYKMKFNYDSNGNISYQYMTSLNAPYVDASSSYKFYSGYGKMDEKFIFSIPVYENMPDELCKRPASSRYLADDAFNSPIAEKNIALVDADR